MSTIVDQDQQRKHGKHFLIPAGALIGLGVGLITGYAGPGILIGLGLGFLTKGFLTPVEGPAPDPATPYSRYGHKWTSVMIGLFMIIIGVAIIWAPVILWPYIIGIILIMLGIMIAVKGWWKVS
jgi:hypothetical protein